jgi:hypothetical protein
MIPGLSLSHTLYKYDTMESSIESLRTIEKPKVSNVRLQLEDLAFGSVNVKELIREGCGILILPFVLNNRLRVW